MTIERVKHMPFTPGDYDNCQPAGRKLIENRLLYVLQGGKRTPREEVDGDMFSDVVDAHRQAVLTELNQSSSLKNTRLLFNVVVLREALDATEDEPWQEPIWRARNEFDVRDRDLPIKDPYVAVTQAVTRFNKVRGEGRGSQPRNPNGNYSPDATVDDTLAGLVQNNRMPKEHFLALRRLLNLQPEGVPALDPRDSQRFHAGLREVADVVADYFEAHTDRNTPLEARVLQALLPQSQYAKYQRRLDPDAICYWQAYIKRNHPAMLQPESRRATEAAMSGFLEALYPPDLRIVN